MRIKLSAIILITVVCGIVNHCHGQCKLVRNENDKFTNNRIIQTGYQQLAVGFRVSISKINSFMYLDLGYTGYTAFSVAEDGEFMILFGDHTKLVLKNMKYTISDAQSYAGLTAWVANLSFILNDDELKELLSKPVVSVRLYTNDGYIEKDVKERNKLKIAESIQCIYTAKLP